MRIMAVAVTLLMLSPNANAEIYKCVENGKTVYAERPCSAKATILNISETPEHVKRFQEEAAARQKSQDAFTDAIRQERAKQPIVIREKYIPPPSQPARPDRCAILLQQIQDAKDDQSVYSGNSIISARARIQQKRAEDAHFSECYGSRN